MDNTVIMVCNTKTCIFNKNNQCTKNGIYIKNGRCEEIKTSKYYNNDGTFKK